MSGRKKKSQLMKLFAIVFLAVLLFSLDIGGFTKPLRSTTDLILNPVRYWFSNQTRTLSAFFRDLSSISSLRNKNNELQYEVYNLESALVEMNSIKKENEFLRQQFNIPQRDSLQLIQAQIIGGDLQVSSAGRFIINKGSSSGVKEGDVVVYSNYFIGQVYDITEHSSSIEMISGGKLDVSAISELNRTKGIVRGDVNTGLVLEKVLREELLEEGELVLTSGIGGFPRDLILGEVVRIEGEDSDVEKRALLRGLMEIQSIEELFVINVEKN